MSEPLSSKEQVSVTVEGLRSLAIAAHNNNKYPEFMTVVLQWAEQASAEIARLRAAVEPKPQASKELFDTWLDEATPEQLRAFIREVRRTHREAGGADEYLNGFNAGRASIEPTPQASKTNAYEGIEDTISWLLAALQCGNFRWDADQHAAATDSLNRAKVELQALHSNEPPAAAEHEALVDELFNASRLWSKAMQQTLTIKQTEAQARLDRARSAVLSALRTTDEPTSARDTGILHDALVHIASNMWDGQACAKFASERLREYRASKPAEPPDDDLLFRMRDWIGSAPHGDNCFVTDEYPGNQCVCGKESLCSAMDEAFGVDEASVQISRREQNDQGHS